ncbi:MAG: ferrochelatase [Candidatus Marinamargulisbacteria bacterium]|nr:ferrochelatase [bacterium]MDG2265201.1 ferrochelatase [Candidatus Marinamargulisbacteria bacterium]|tara:strand:+ start:4149 stop:5159 length:1011 start_codon:yes stop_codon:yes gene_type:complete
MNAHGFLLVNLGTPDSPSVSDVRRYLGEFLMDEYVIDLPYWVRWLLIRGIILNVRPKKAAAAYQSIWTKDGSPLYSISRDLTQAIQMHSEAPVELAMRYGNPSIRHGLQQLKNQGVKQVTVVPLYPQYAMATTQTVNVAVNAAAKALGMTVDSVPPFYSHPGYIQALANSIQPHIDNTVDYLLMSYHGIPVRHVKKTDPGQHCFQSKDCCFIPNADAHAVCYPHQVKQTSLSVVQAMQHPPKQWSWSFQSRFGLDQWLTPFTDAEIKRLAQSGVRHLAVCCPAFVADCLETLEEIGDEGAEIFLENGGEKFTMIPCLNTQPDWVMALSNIIQKQPH